MLWTHELDEKTSPAHFAIDDLFHHRIMMSRKLEALALWLWYSVVNTTREYWSSAIRYSFGGVYEKHFTRVALSRIVHNDGNEIVPCANKRLRPKIHNESYNLHTP